MQKQLRRLQEEEEEKKQQLTMKEMLLQKKRMSKVKKKIPRKEDDPAERVTATGDLEGFNLVYLHNRYQGHQPPICVYIPS